MKRNMLRRTTFREIRGSFGRFFAILAIIALGAGFFSGVRMTTPDMVHTLDHFWQEEQLYDYRLLSTLGWEETDVQAFRTQEGVRFAEGSRCLDVLYADDEADAFVLKTHSLPQYINTPALTAGRLPESVGECVIDDHLHMEIGDTLHVAADNEADTTDALIFTELTVVGTANSPYYANFERGTTSIGNGSVAGFVYVLPEAFDMELYTEIFIRFDQDDVIYSKSYKDTMEAHDAVWEALTDTQAQARYDRVTADAEAELQDGRDELAEKRAEGRQELDDAKAELDDAAQQLDDARTELDDAAAQLTDGEQELADARAQLDDSAQELDDARGQLDDAAAQLSASKAQLDSSEAELRAADAQLTDSKAALDSAEQQLLAGEAQLADGQARLDAAAAELAENKMLLAQQAAMLDEQEAQFHAQADALLPYLDQLPEEQRAQLLAAQAQIADGRTQLAAGQTQLAAAEQEIAAQQAVLDESRATLAAARQEWESGKAQYDAGLAAYRQGLAAWENGRRQYENGLAGYNTAMRQYEDGLAQYEEGEAAYTQALAEYEDGKASYEEGLAAYEDGVAEYEDGLAEYENGLREFDEKIAEAEAELADAEQALADLEAPDAFVLDRNTNIGYACFESDSQIVEQVARVFPIFFILVAALVCMTTMSRMVEEQRTQIGVLKALGYSEAAIMGKFMFYSGSAAVLGCVIGYAVGTLLFPAVIWYTYELMYIALPLRFVFDWQLALAAIGVSLLCSVGTTWAACRFELAETAAGLMRPKAPKAGKRVLLERVPFIWNRMKFLHKVSVRNIFRYKGRFFMMIVGISGCTALLLTGFGLNDSVAGFAEVQFDDIQITDAEVQLRSGHASLPAALERALSEQAEAYLPLHEASWDLLAGDKVKSVSVLAPFGSMDGFMALHTLRGEPLQMPGSGEILVSNSISERYGVRTGDSITLRDEDMHELHVTVTGVFENHVYNYVVLSPDTLTEQLGAAPEINAAYVNFGEDTDAGSAAAALSEQDDIASVSLFQDLKSRISNMMNSMNYIVLLIIICAAGLAFIVLYNLTNINITERIREIATIKVLGFFRSETSAYVLRENLALTALGTLCGLALGILLHSFVMRQIVVDLVSFRVRILPMSFVYSIALTFIFNFLVNLVMGTKLERINMAESLKSVD